MVASVFLYVVTVFCMFVGVLLGGCCNVVNV